MPIHFCVVCGCSHASRAELSSCNRDHMAHTIENVYSLALFQTTFAEPCYKSLRKRQTTQQKNGQGTVISQVEDTRWPINMKKCSASLLIREIQMKSLLETLLSAARMAKMRNSIPVIEDVEQLECPYAARGGRIDTAWQYLPKPIVCIPFN